MKTIYNVYVPMESQEQCDRMKQLCIDYDLPIWGYKKAFYFESWMYFFYSDFREFAVDSYLGKPKKDYIQVTEQEFIELLKNTKL